MYEYDKFASRILSMAVSHTNVLASRLSEHASDASDVRSGNRWPPLALLLVRYL